MIGQIKFGGNGESLEIISSGTKEEYTNSHSKSLGDPLYKPFKVTVSDGRTFKLRITTSHVRDKDATDFAFAADDVTDTEPGAPAHASGGRCDGYIKLE